jgi:PAS domain S-box-containing protein
VKGDMTKEQLLDELRQMRRQLQLVDSCRQEMQVVQARYEKLLESAPDAMLFVNQDARIMLVNAQFEKLFGYAEEELVGKDLHTLIPQRYRDGHRNNVANYFSSPHPRPMGSGLEIRGLRKDNTEFPADISLSPLDAEGERLVIASIRDVTERKRAEAQIERNYRIQTGISSILKVSLEPISLDEQLNKVLDLILTIPGLFPHATGHIYLVENEPEVLVLKAPRTSGDAQPPPCDPQGRFCVPVVSSGQTLGLINIMTEEGSERIPEAETFLVAVANTLAAVIMRHQAETERNKFREQLSESEKLAALGRIAANVADEMRNPLTAIGGFARRLEKKILEGSKEREYLAFMVAEVTRLEGILRSVLSLSRGAGLTLEQCNLRQIVEEAVRMFEEVCRERSITIERVYGETPLIQGEKERILEATENLISNAIDAMPSGGTLSITTGKEVIKGVLYATVKVSDTGEGIKEEHVKKIFEPFFTTRVASKGVGLGLSLTKKFVEDHGGMVHVESEVGTGSTFVLYFPDLTK